MAPGSLPLCLFKLSQQESLSHSTTHIFSYSRVNPSSTKSLIHTPSKKNIYICTYMNLPNISNVNFCNEMESTILRSRLKMRPCRL